MKKISMLIMALSVVMVSEGVCSSPKPISQRTISDAVTNSRILLSQIKNQKLEKSRNTKEIARLVGEIDRKAKLVGDNYNTTRRQFANIADVMRKMDDRSRDTNHQNDNSTMNYGDYFGQRTSFANIDKGILDKFLGEVLAVLLKVHDNQQKIDNLQRENQRIYQKLEELDKEPAKQSVQQQSVEGVEGYERTIRDLNSRLLSNRNQISELLGVNAELQSALQSFAASTAKENAETDGFVESLKNANDLL